ncbi:MAG TPA: hemerythrin domain-containing protein [Pseudobdellovibrionaceae bacterium]|nr:hemerythrin domain-containing protein [Pseudobdellovibrionaceae bacterium]
MEERYRIGVPEMDAQHARLFELLERAQVPDPDEGEVQLLVLDLVNYAKSHLELEEKFLAEQGLHDFLKSHVGLHRDFRVRAMEVYNALREADSLELKQKILRDTVEFCDQWLREHIDVEDRAYADLLRAKGSVAVG